MVEEVSVIMAVYNGEDYLEESIESIIKQTHPQFELIIVNDGSTDRTEKILSDLSDPRVKVYHLAENHGVSFARNYAIGKARNQWILLQDDDDISSPTRIEEQMNYIREHPEVICVLSRFRLVRENTHGKERSLRSVKKGPFFTRSQLKSRRFYCPWICYGSALVLKQAILQAGGYDNECRLGEDYDLFLRLIELGPIDMVPHILYQYRLDPNSVSRSNSRAETRRAIIKIAIKNIKTMFETKGIEPSFVILGTMEACESFRSNISSETGISMKLYPTSSKAVDLTQAFSLFKHKKVNGIIVLGRSNQTGKILRLLIQMGMTLNMNLFHLKNFKR